MRVPPYHCPCPPILRHRSFALHSQYLYTWQSFGWVVGGGAVMVAVIIAILQGSLVISLLMVLSIVMVVLQVCYWSWFANGSQIHTTFSEELRLLKYLETAFTN